MGATAPDGARNIDNFLDIGGKAADYPEESRNVDKIKKEVDEAEFIVGRNINTVYNLNGAEGRATWEAGPGDGGGQEEILRSPETEEAQIGRNGGQDAGPVPPGRPAAAGVPGGERTPGAPSGWLSDGGVRAWTPAEETGPGLPSASGEMRWAEQADRAFRRDSRRYDGGFYLY